MPKYKFIKNKRREKRHDPFIIRSGKFRDGKLERVSRSGWAEDTYIADKGEKETIGRNFNFGLLPVVGVVFGFFMMVLLARTAWLQVIKGDYYYSQAEGNRIRVERIEPRRGIIYDRYLRPLVRNKANFLLYVVPADLPEGDNLKEIVKGISTVLDGASEEEINSRVASVKKKSLEYYQPLFIADNIQYEKAMSLYLKSDNWPGVVLTNKTRREYLALALDTLGEEEVEMSGKDKEIAIGFSLSHILGYTGKINEDELKKFGGEYLPIDYIGKMGIEYFWENELKGRGGEKRIEVDALRKEKEVLSISEAEDGHNLVLSVDALAQAKLEKIMREQLEKLNLSKASAVALDPGTGEVIALVSLPAYNNNQFARGISSEEYALLTSDKDKPLFNRSISGEYPSGSTIKPVIAAAALEEGVISERTSFLSVGGIRIGQWFFPDWRAGGHGRVSVRRAIAESVNTFFYSIGGGYEDFRGLGVDKIVHYGSLFGLGTQTGIDLAGEASGFLPTREWKEEVKGERWYIGDTYHLAIGQGDLLVTPLQVAVFTSVFANRGKLYRPHFIKNVLSGEDKPIKETEAVPVREDFIDDYNINVVREGMRQTVTAGSARSMQTVPVAVAGKTGTAQWSSKLPTHAWFTGFAPFDDPEIVITILIEQGGEGSETAVPVAREFLTWYFSKDRELDGT